MLLVSLLLFSEPFVDFVVFVVSLSEKKWKKTISSIFDLTFLGTVSKSKSVCIAKCVSLSLQLGIMIKLE